MPSEFRTPLIVGGAVIGVSAVIAAVAVLTPTPAPTSTTVNADGETVTVSWEDYPAHAYTSPEEALAAPTEAEIAEHWASIAPAIEDRNHWDLDFAPTAYGDGWYPQTGNGYGGASRQVSYNSEEQFTTGIPPREDWPELVAIVDEVLAEYGFAPLVFDYEDPQQLGPSEWLLERFGSTDPEEWSAWNGSAYADGEWFSLSIWNDELFPGDEEPETDELRGPHGVSFSYGATTVRDTERAAFEREIEPFLGLVPPEATRSE